MCRLQYGWVSTSACSTSHSSWACVLAGAWLTAVIYQNQGPSPSIRHALTCLGTDSLASLPQNWLLTYFSFLFCFLIIFTSYLSFLQLCDSCFHFFFFFFIKPKAVPQVFCRGHDPTKLCCLTGWYWLYVSSPLKPSSFNLLASIQTV